MNASKRTLRIAIGVAAGFIAAGAMAEQGLNAMSQNKVNNAKAKMWNTSEGKNPMEANKSVVNFGHKNDGSCNMNVGTTEAGKKAPKDIVVTAKSIINVCK